MKRWILLSNRLDRFNQSIAIVLRWSIIFMLGIGAWNVIGRYLGAGIGYNLSSNALIETQWYLFSLIFLFGFSWTLQKKGHVRVDVLQGRLMQRRRLQIELFGTIFLLLPFAIGVMITSINPTLQSWQINELSPDPNGLPRYLIKTLLPLGFLLLTLQGISEIIKDYSKLKATKSFNRSFNSKS